MTQQQPPEKNDLFVHDPARGDYVGYVEVQGRVEVRVPAELLNRMLLQRMKHDETADLTSIQTWIDAIACEAKPAKWLNNPLATVIPISLSAVPSSLSTPPPPVVPPPPPESEVQLVPPLPERVSKRFNHPGKDEMMAYLRERAQHFPPHVWEDMCRTPTFPKEEPVASDVRANRGRVRHEEKKILAALYDEWVRGDFTLDERAEAELDERDAAKKERYQEEQQRVLAGTIKAVIGAVNSTSLTKTPFVQN